MENTFGEITSDALDELHRIVKYGNTNEERLIACELILDTYRHVSDVGGEIWIPEAWDRD